MAEENAGIRLFGFQLTQPDTDSKSNNHSFVPPTHDDGAIVLETGGNYGSFVDMDGSARNEVELITRYREMSQQPELEMAIDDITNESIVVDDNGNSIKVNVDQLDTDKGVKNKIVDEFKTVLKLLNWRANGHDIFRRWYVDGRLFFHLIIDENNPQKGIQEIRYVDPRRIRKIREVKKEKDPRTGAEIITKTQEYYSYNERGVMGTHTGINAVPVAVDSIANVNSGLMDSRRAMVISYLHKAIKPLNQLRMMEDATVIYKVSRAPDRRVFYIDVGNLPKTKAEQYLRDMMTKYRNKLVYDSATGEVRDDRKFQSMLEDFWLPRRGESGKGTEIQTLPGGESLANMDNVIYFQKKLYQSLGVPVGRLLPNDGFSLGKSNEITREELRFSKFIDRLRKKFSTIFDILLSTQLSLKNICSKEDWDSIHDLIWYDFLKDNNFQELRDAELLVGRVNVLQAVDPFVGRYFSGKWVQKNVLRFTDEQIKAMDTEIEDETEAHDVKLPPVHPDSPFYVPPESQDEAQPNADQTASMALTPGESDADTAFKALKMDESVEPETLNTINRVMRTRKQ